MLQHVAGWGELLAARPSSSQPESALAPAAVDVVREDSHVLGEPNTPSGGTALGVSSSRTIFLNGELLELPSADHLTSAIDAAQGR